MALIPGPEQAINSLSSASSQEKPSSPDLLLSFLELLASANNPELTQMFLSRTLGLGGEALAYTGCLLYLVTQLPLPLFFRFVVPV